VAAVGQSTNLCANGSGEIGGAFDVIRVPMCHQDQ